MKTQTERMALVADDEVEWREALGGYVRALGFRPVCVPSISEARKVIDTGTVSLLVLDVYFHGYDPEGVDFVEEISGGADLLPTVIVTDCISRRMRVRANEAGAHWVSKRGLTLKSFSDAVTQCLADHRDAIGRRRPEDEGTGALRLGKWLLDEVRKDSDSLPSLDLGWEI